MKKPEVSKQNGVLLKFAFNSTGKESRVMWYTRFFLILILRYVFRYREKMLANNTDIGFPIVGYLLLHF